MLNKIKCNQLIKKAKILNEAPILGIKEISKLENQLQVILPNDFKYINNLYDYEYIGIFSFYNFRQTGIQSVIGETLALREAWNLPKEYIVLAEDDVSMLLLKTISAEESEVIWCDEPDFFNLCDGQPMQYNPTIFPSFTDFFEFLIDEEEKMQAEDRALEEQASKE
jgi:hypothetical protein